MSCSVLHVQTDSGLAGGIATYIGSLTKTRPLRAYRFYVAVPRLNQDPVAAAALYAGTAVRTSETYGPLSFLRYVRELVRLVRANDVQIIHAHALRAGLASAVASLCTGARFVYTNHGLRFSQKKGVATRWIFFMLEALVCWRADYVVCLRDHDRKAACRVPTVRAHKLRTVVTRIPGFCQAAQSREKPLLVGAGSLIGVKRPDRFVDWLKALSARGVVFDAMWIGDGPLRPAMEEYARAHNVAVAWHGHASRADMEKILQQSTVLLLTSDFEVFPLVVLEAFSCGVPVVTTRFPGVEDILDSGSNGLVLNSDNPDEIANHLHALLTKRERLWSMSRAAALTFRERYSDPSIMGFQYAELYQSLCRRETE